MRSKTTVALIVWLAALRAVMAAPIAVKQVMLESLPRLAQDKAYQAASAASSVQTPSVAEIARRFNQILTSPLSQDPEYGPSYRSYQTELLSSLPENLGVEGVTDGEVAEALEKRAQVDNAQAETLLSALWAANRISLEGLKGFEVMARSLLAQGRPFLTRENLQTVESVIKAVSAHNTQVLEQDIRQAGQIAEDLRRALVRQGLFEPDPGAWSNKSTESEGRPGKYMASLADAVRELERTRLNRPDSVSPQVRRVEPPAPDTGANQALRTAAGNIAEAFKSGFSSYQGRNLFYHPFIYEGSTARLKGAEGSELLNISLEHRTDGKLLVRSRIWYIQRLLAMGGFMAEATDEVGVYRVSPKQVSTEKSLQWYEELHRPRLSKRVTHEMIASVFIKALPEGENEAQFRANGSSGDGIAVVTRPKNRWNSARTLLLAESTNINPEGIYVRVFEDYPDFPGIMAASGLYAEYKGNGYYLVHSPVRTPENARWGGDILGQPE